MKYHAYQRNMLKSGICSRCRNKIDESKAYCSECGKVYLIFNAKDSSGKECFYHDNRKASNHCSYCNHFICDKDNPSDKGWAPVPGGYRKTICATCDKKIKKLKESFDKFMCPNHPVGEKIKASIKCDIGNEKLCKDCAGQFTIDGNVYSPIEFKKKPWYKKWF